MQKKKRKEKSATGGRRERTNKNRTPTGGRERHTMGRRERIIREREGTKLLFPSNTDPR